MEQWQTEQLERLHQSEERAYARRDETGGAISFIIGEELMENSFFFLRQLFSEYEEAEERCCKTTDRLTEFRSTL